MEPIDATLDFCDESCIESVNLDSTSYLLESMNITFDDTISIMDGVEKTNDSSYSDVEKQMIENEQQSDVTNSGVVEEEVKGDKAKLQTDSDKNEDERNVNTNKKETKEFLKGSKDNNEPIPTDVNDSVNQNGRRTLLDLNVNNKYSAEENKDNNLKCKRKENMKDVGKSPTQDENKKLKVILDEVAKSNVPVPDTKIEEGFQPIDEKKEVEDPIVNGVSENIDEKEVVEEVKVASAVDEDIAVQDDTFDDEKCIEHIRAIEEASNQMNIGGGDGSDKTDVHLVGKDSPEKLPHDVIKVKKCRVKLPMRGEKFRVKVIDNFNLPHKLFLKNTDKVEKRKLNMLLAKKLLQPLTRMPIFRLRERNYVLVKFSRPAKLIRAQVKWIEREDNIEVQDIDTGSFYRISSQDIYVLDDEALAHIYPRLFICTLSEFDGQDIYWNAMIKNLYLSTLHFNQIAIEVKNFHQNVQTYEVHIKLLVDEKKFININDWLANSLIPYLSFLKTCPVSQQRFSREPPEDIFFPYVKLMKQ